MNGPGTTLAVGLEDGIGVVGQTRVMREVEDAGDAGVDGTEQADQVPGEHVSGPVVQCGAAVGHRDVLVDVGVTDQPPQLILPAVPVAIDQARQDHHARQVKDDHVRVRGLHAQVRTDRLDDRSVDQDITGGQIADLRVHRQHRRAPQQDAAAAGGPQQPVPEDRQGPFVPVVVAPWRSGHVAHRGSSHSRGNAVYSPDDDAGRQGERHGHLARGLDGGDGHLAGQGAKFLAMQPDSGQRWGNPVNVRRVVVSHDPRHVFRAAQAPRLGQRVERAEGHQVVVRENGGGQITWLGQQHPGQPAALVEGGLGRHTGEVNLGGARCGHRVREPVPPVHERADVGRATQLGHPRQYRAPPGEPRPGSRHAGDRAYMREGRSAARCGRTGAADTRLLAISIRIGALTSRAAPTTTASTRRSRT